MSKERTWRTTGLGSVFTSYNTGSFGGHLLYDEELTQFTHLVLAIDTTSIVVLPEFRGRKTLKKHPS